MSQTIRSLAFAYEIQIETSAWFISQAWPTPADPSGRPWPISQAWPIDSLRRQSLKAWPPLAHQPSLACSGCGSGQPTDNPLDNPIDTPLDNPPGKPIDLLRALRLSRELQSPITQQAPILQDVVSSALWGAIRAGLHYVFEHHSANPTSAKPTKRCWGKRRRHPNTVPAAQSPRPQHHLNADRASPGVLGVGALVRTPHPSHLSGET